MLSSVEARYLPNEMFATHRDLFDTFDANTGLYRTIAYTQRFGCAFTQFLIPSMICPFRSKQPHIVCFLSD